MLKALVLKAIRENLCPFAVNGFSILLPRIEQRHLGREVSQGSKAIRLQEGRRYSLTALLRELEGEDFIGIGWTRPGGLEPEIIDGTHLRVK